MKLTRLFDCLTYQNQNFPLEDCLVAKIDGQWQKTSTQTLVTNVNQLSNGLLAQGVKPKDNIGLISFNRPEWVCTDLAIAQLGAINVPMYPNATPKDYRFIIEDAQLRLLFAGDEEIYKKLIAATEDMAEPPSIYTFDEVTGAPHWTTLLKPCSEQDLEIIEKHKSVIDTNDLATIIYTSGTTGNPKGVMLSHHNILTNASAVGKVFGISEPGHRALSFLPLCHIFARTALYTYMHIGIGIYYAESIDTIGDNLREVKPHLFATVPRLLEKVYDKIVAKGYELTGIKRQLFFWALNLGHKYEPNKSNGVLYDLQLKIANKLIFSKWREALGGNIKFIISGAAALQPRLARVFWAAQIKILEAYGLTETSPGVSFTRTDPANARIGCVGPLLEGVEVKIAEDGEILVKGPNVMMGYYNRPDLTAEVIDGDGWFHTGDIGTMVEDKFLKITDRKKEIFKTSGGKYIAPQVMENKFKESLLIEQIMVVGEGEKFPAALIVPSYDNLREWCYQHNLTYTSDNEMICHPEVCKKFDKEIDRLNEHFAQYEKVKKYSLVEQVWSIDGGELTPTLKLKRKVIFEKHEETITFFYAN